MPLLPRDAAYVWDIVEAAEAIQGYIAGLDLVRYAQNRQIRSAVERELEIIGEAARRLSVDFRSEHPEIPWTSIVAHWISSPRLCVRRYGIPRTPRAAFSSFSAACWR